MNATTDGEPDLPVGDVDGPRVAPVEQRPQGSGGRLAPRPGQRGLLEVIRVGLSAGQGVNLPDHRADGGHDPGEPG